MLFQVVSFFSNHSWRVSCNSAGFVIEKLHGLKFEIGWHGHRYWLACGFISFAIGWLVGSFLF